jgi:hypothetical protein
MIEAIGSSVHSSVFLTPETLLSRVLLWVGQDSAVFVLELTYSLKFCSALVRFVWEATNLSAASLPRKKALGIH